MTSVTTGTLHPHLREEEVLVVENAIRLAIDSIINVLYGVNSARTNEYQRMVGDRDKEIQRLECRLRELEREQRPPPPVCSCRLQQQQADCSRFLVAQVSSDPQPAQQSRYDPSSSDPELVKPDVEDSTAGGEFSAILYSCVVILYWKNILIRKLKTENLRCNIYFVVIRRV